MLDVTEQLRRYGEAVEEAVLAKGPAERRPRRRRCLEMAAAAAVAVVAVATGLVLARSDDDADRQLRTADAPPSPIVDSEAAQPLCETKGREGWPDATLRAAFESSRAEVNAWRDTRHGPDGPRGYPATGPEPPTVERVVVCYFDGLFPVPSLRGSPPATRAIILATADSAQLETAGPKEGLEIARLSVPVPSSASPLAARFIGAIWKLGNVVTPGPASDAVFDNGAQFPPGTERYGGWEVGEPTGSLYTVAHFHVAPRHEVFLFNRGVGAGYRVVDVLEVDVIEGEWLEVDCMLNGQAVLDRTIAGVIHEVPGTSSPARLAWRFDRATERVVPIDPAAVRCELHVA